MTISIAICTYNRADVLTETLASLLACLNESVDSEVLVVDNNSTDATGVIAKTFCARNPGFRYIFEQVQGLSHARNTAIAQAKGDVIAFADDDVYFDAGWLENLANCFTSDLHLDCLGGKVVPHFEEPPPDWLAGHMMWIYGATRYGDVSKVINPPDIPIGCNMAFRTSVFKRIGAFDVALGRVGKSLLSNEESELFGRMAQAGMVTRYAPNVSVLHRIPPARLKQAWVKNRYFWQGVSDVALRTVVGQQTSRLDFFRLAVSAIVRILQRVWVGEKGPREFYWRMTVFSARLNFQYDWGVVNEAVRNIFRTYPANSVSYK